MQSLQLPTQFHSSLFKWLRNNNKRVVVTRADASADTHQIFYDDLFLMGSHDNGVRNTTITSNRNKVRNLIKQLDLAMVFGITMETSEFPFTMQGILQYLREHKLFLSEGGEPKGKIQFIHRTQHHIYTFFIDPNNISYDAAHKNDFAIEFGSQAGCVKGLFRLNHNPEGRPPAECGHWARMPEEVR